MVFLCIKPVCVPAEFFKSVIFEFSILFYTCVQHTFKLLGLNLLLALGLKSILTVTCIQPYDLNIRNVVR